MTQMLILEIGPCTERQYADKQGQQQLFAERRVKLTDGLNTVNAFLTGDRARKTPLVAAGDFASVELSFSAREWNTQQGEKRYETVVYVERIGSLWKQ